MDRPRREEHRPLAMVAVPSAAAPIRSWLIQPSLRALVGWWPWAVAVVVVVVVAAFAALWPRARDADALLAENLALRERLVRVDEKMAEVDRLLLRMRLYDAQLESLGAPAGPGGPMEPGPFANDALGVVGAELLHGGERSGADWAAAVEARASTFVAAFSHREPSIARLMAEMEEIEALERALPSSWPASGPLTSGFGWRRHPLGQRWRFHSGIDLAGDRGDPIFASSPGVVVEATYSGGYGRHLIIDHGFGIRTLYAHCHRLLVQQGDRVRVGQRIALLGNTGLSTGPHLHFEVHLDGTPVNPLDYLNAQRRPGP